MQARKQAIEADLVATKVELERLQLREKKLAARNALLEKVATLNETNAAAQSQVIMRAPACYNISSLVHQHACITKSPLLLP